jgi:hypothetical protein
LKIIKRNVTLIKILDNMGNNAPEKCYITDFETSIKLTAADLIEYSITYEGREILLSFAIGHINSQVVNDNKQLLKKIFLGTNFNIKTHGSPLTNKILEELIQFTENPF